MLMHARKKVLKIVGRLDPDALYTAEGALRFGGLSRDEIGLGRRAKVIKAYECGRRIYYRGCDLIAWILKAAGEEVR
jgi:hypothetical protein